MDFKLTREQQDIVKAARKFAQGEFTEDLAHEFDRNETFDRTLLQKACENGFVGVYIDEAYGGAGMDFLDAVLIVEEFWAVDPGIAQTVLCATFGAELLLLYGSEDQKQALLPGLVTGEEIIATAITEPNAGSDTAAATTRAVKEGDEWVISGSKMFITNGTVADNMLVFCVTDPDAPRHERFSFIVVPTNAEGFTAKKISGKMGIRASDTAEVTLQNVRVPLENLVGVRGKGFYELMNFLNHTRVIVAAHGVGLARGALEEAVKYAKARNLFGQSLAQFQATQFKIAEMATLVRAARNLTYEAAAGLDSGKVDPSLVAMAKWYAADTAVKCADHALQIHGGYGYIDEYKVNRLYRDAKILELYEGTTEVEKLIVAKSCLG
jgi:alkylation response protein AidB-like acyl-CoA dehydrogenase